MSAQPSETTAHKAVTLHSLRALCEKGEKFSVLTCYDASFARLLSQAGVEVLLVGDSLGMVLQGHTSTLPVRLEEMAYHTQCVARGNRGAWLMADLPFGAYQQSLEQGIASAAQLMQAGAQMIKLEGGEDWVMALIGALVQRGIPVCAHLGLTPQSVHALGGYRVQGRDAAGRARLVEQAQRAEAAGAAMVLLELMPSETARAVTEALRVPTIGIGAGPFCSAQVLVLHDMMGITPAPRARFVRDFTAGGLTLEQAARLFVAEVKAGRYPAEQHGY